MSPVKLKQPARIVGGAAAGGEPPQIEAGADVVRAARVRQHVRHLERRVELIPVGAAAAEPGEVADVDAREPGVAVAHVAVEARECRATSRRLPVPLTANGVQRVEVDAVIADAEVVVQVRRQRVGVGDQRVLVDARLRHRGRRDRGVEDVAAEAVVPVVAERSAGSCCRGSDRRAPAADRRCRCPSAVACRLLAVPGRFAAG